MIRSRTARLGAIMLLLASPVGTGVAAPPLPSGGPESEADRLEEEEEDRVPLEVEIDRDSIDLEHHRLSLTMSRPPDRVRLKVIGESGAILAEEETSFRGKPAGARLTVTWRPKTQEALLRIEVFAYDVDGYYKGIAITPWSLGIPHAEVNFQTNSAEIVVAEEPKLHASLERITEASRTHEDLGPVGLYIVGHTDTVGSAEHNQALSERRARSIATWFRQHGLELPIGYAGAGELAPKVPTKDEVDEPRNRRVDYLLALEPPHLRAGGRPLVFRRL